MTPPDFDNAQQLQSFLDHLQRGGKAGYYWLVDPQTTAKRSHWWNGTGRPLPPKTHDNLYFGVFPTNEIPKTNAKGESRESKHVRSRIDLIAALNCLFAEFDAKDYGNDMDATLRAVHALSPRPSVVVTSGGGYHCYWLLDEPWALTSDAEREHAKQVQYAWVDYTGGDEASKDLARVLRVPGSLNYKYTPPRPVAFVWCELDRLYTRDALIHHCERLWAQQTMARAEEMVRQAPDGLKHKTLLRAARLGGGVADVLGDAAVARALAGAIAPRAADMRLAEQTIADGIAYGRAAPLRLTDTPSALPVRNTRAADSDAQPIAEQQLSYIFKCLGEDEAGDAQLLAELYRDLLCYDVDADIWYAFAGHVWIPFDGPPRKLVWGTVAAAYLDAAATLQGEVANVGELDPKRAETMKSVDRLLERAKKLRTLRRSSNVLTLAQELLSVKGEQWDADPWIIAVANGVVDLRTGELREGRPDDYLRLVAPTTWDSLDAPAPRWERFVSEVLSDERDRVDFLQRLLGFALNGTTKEHVLAVCVGERGRNGKRVLFETLQHVLGPYAGAVSTDVLVGQERGRGAGQAQPHLMDLQGRRIAYASETGEYDQLSAAQVKNITGGDPITARRLHENLVTFKPSHTIFLQTNRKPQAPADDDALWERVKVLEFKVRFVEAPKSEDERPRDPLLEDALQAEASGILAWLVRGHLIWQRDGLRTPDSVALARDKYRQEESINPFLESCCEEWDGGSAEGGALYSAYQEWCKVLNLRAKSTVWMGKQLAQRFEKTRVTSGQTAGRSVYHGVGLRNRGEWTVQTSEHSSTTLQYSTNPSAPIGTPNNAIEESPTEGLGSFSKSSMHFLPHEEKYTDIPSNPSGLSEGEAFYRITKPTEGFVSEDQPRGPFKTEVGLQTARELYAAGGAVAVERWLSETGRASLIPAALAQLEAVPAGGGS